MKFGETLSSTKLIIRGWFEKNRRELPWRLTKDPYSIWISEVILQQTRVCQGLAYYIKFMNSFPDVASLAYAEEDEVLKIWQGLGYYSRARNLHQAAKDLMEQRNGIFPTNYSDILELKGVGPYTAAAIASICFGEPIAVVDGNVSRVMARLFGVDEPVNRPEGAKQIKALAQAMMDEPSGSPDPGNHNQAIMEFGALQCTPLSPSCNSCPLSSHCHAYLTGRVDQLPLKIRAKKPVDRWCYFYIIRSHGEIILEKRGNRDIWRSLYQFPMMEFDKSQSEVQITETLTQQLGTQHLRFTLFSKTIRHQLSHRTIHARFIHVERSDMDPDLPPGWIRVPIHQIDNYPVPRLIHRYLESINL